MATTVHLQPTALAQHNLAYTFRGEPPCVVLLREDFSILRACPHFARLCAEAGCFQADPNHLPTRLKHIVEQVLASNEVVHVDEVTLVRVTALRGSPGGTLAVVFERICLRAPVESASRRFGLTAREQEVLTLVLRGCSANDIAVQLRISRNTVAEHFKHLAQKIGVHNRAELVARALGWSEA